MECIRCTNGTSSLSAYLSKMRQRRPVVGNAVKTRLLTRFRLGAMNAAKSIQNKTFIVELFY